MRSLLKFLVDTAIIFITIYLLLLFTFSFKLINPNFLINSLRKPGVYEQTTKAIRLSIKSFIESNVEQEVGSLENLTVGERAVINSDIEKVTSLVTNERVQELSETNIVRITDYISGNSDNLYLYIPVKKWELDKRLISSDALSLLNEETDVVYLLETFGAGQSVIDSINNLSNYKEVADNNLKLFSLSLVLLYVANYFLTKKKGRFQSTSTILSLSGLLIIALGGLLVWVSNRLTASLPYINNATQAIVATVTPPVLSELAKFWLIIGGAFILSGIVLAVSTGAFSRSEENRKLAKTQEKTV